MMMLSSKTTFATTVLSTHKTTSTTSARTAVVTKVRESPNRVDDRARTTTRRDAIDDDDATRRTIARSRRGASIDAIDARDVRAFATRPRAWRWMKPYEVVLCDRVRRREGTCDVVVRRTSRESEANASIGRERGVIHSRATDATPRDAGRRRSALSTRSLSTMMTDACARTRRDE